jgi:hypothetical protein
MVLGMSLSTFTLLHVVISLIGIATGCVVTYGLLRRTNFPSWTALFLTSTILTSVTGFLFPIEKVTPGLVLGVLSLIALSVSVVALYVRHLSGAWRKAYVTSALVSLYFNVFVLIVQSFEKVPSLHALAPTQKEAPFVVAQLTVLVLAVVVTVMAVRRFQQESTSVPKSIGKAA